jgi:hypothetical protein
LENADLRCLTTSTLGNRSALAVPAGVNSKIFNALNKNNGNFDDFDDFDDFGAIHQTRMITTAIFIGILLLFLIPFGVWKSIGQARLTKLINQWEAEDARSREPGTFVPVWKAKLSLNPYTVRKNGEPQSSTHASLMQLSSA